ncbi:phage portal protein [Tardiphaga alba]|uniref:Phage portal protein n=1 Tax=Tardiphaga alba TaxID=340268 RepID=A0ABX8A5T7_9BRAD|nr:phage portal protein [Tardiphaga alba]QUS39054.1 phage portal protein [Tardiphaga alba]
MRIGSFRLFETKALPQTDEDLLALLRVAGVAGVTRQQALAQPAVAASIRALSDAVSSLPIKIVQVADDGTETDVSHAVGKLLRGAVNDWTSGSDFFRNMMATALTRDQGAIAVVNRVGDGKIAELIQYAPGIVQAEYDANTCEPTYKLDGRTLDARNIIHLRKDERCPLTLAMNAIAVAHHLEQHALNLFAQGARPGGVLEFPDELSPKAEERMLAGWKRMFGGSNNAGNTAALYGGATFNQMTMSSVDAQMLECRRFQTEEIARSFGVPVQMIGDLTKSSYANAEQKQKEFLLYGCEPWLLAFESALNRAVFNDEERDTYRVKFDRDDITRADLVARANATNSLIASETINPNEARSWFGYAPYVGGEKFGNRNITVKQIPTGQGERNVSE